MSKFKCSVALLTVSAAVVASGVFAQNPERRERLRKAAGAAKAIAGVVAERVDDVTTPQLSGRVVILQGLENEADGEPTAPQGSSTWPSQEVNNGGLVIVEVHDTQSRPTTFGNPHIEPSDAFEEVGRVRGVGMKDGKPLMGGGYTWLLLKPVSVGEVAITVSYTPNGGDGKQVTRTHNVTVTEPQQDSEVEAASYERAK